MRVADRNLLSAILATGVTVLLIAFAVTDTTGWFVLLLLFGFSKITICSKERSSEQRDQACV